MSHQIRIERATYYDMIEAPKEAEDIRLLGGFTLSRTGL